MYKRTLNHYSKFDTYQFLTFRTQDSVEDYLQRVKQISGLSICPQLFLGIPAITDKLLQRGVAKILEAI